MELPLILAGPILRRAQPRAVAVWMALSRPASVALSLWEGLRRSGTTAAPVVRSAPVATLRVGERLHVVLAVAEIATPSVPLQPGVNYAYGLDITVDDETNAHTLASEGLLGRFDGAGLAADAWASEEPLGYAAGLLPSFALPPAELTDLRLVYGSCRRVANAHFDAMPWIDTLIADAFSGQSRAEGAVLGTAATTRPHLLFLGGDQIYADDVSPLHLVLCNRLAQQLISGSDAPAAPAVEQLHASGALSPSGTTFGESLLLGRTPSTDVNGAVDRAERAFPATLGAFPPGGRYDLTVFDARFTSSDGASHLLSVGEFAAMYVSVYADWFWSGLKDAAGFWRGLADVSIDATAKSPGPLPADASCPLHSQSLLDTKAAGYFGNARWTAWNDIAPRPRDGTGPLAPRNPKKLDHCFASFMMARLARSDLPTGFEGFRALIGDPAYLMALTPSLRGELEPDTVTAMEALAEKNASVFRTFMRQLQARVMRDLVDRFGIARLADVDCRFDAEDEANGFAGPVLQHGPVAILAEAKKRERLYDEGGDDRWRTHLDALLQSANLVWTELVTLCLAKAEPKPWRVPDAPTLTPEVDPAEPPDLADAVLAPAVIAQLATGWADDPAPDQRQAFSDTGYTNLSRTMLARCIAELATDHVWSVYRSLHGQLRHIRTYALGQPKVRRALANVPTHMIFDDHDVTDDWNLNPVWCRRVYGADAQRSQPLGRQIVRNALAAYAVFQDWGNDLARYAPGGTGAQVLQQVGQLFAPGAAFWPQPAATAELDRLFGLDTLPQPVDAARPRGRHAAVDAPMAWHYTLAGPQFTVAVLDNRTRRGFASAFGPPGNVGTTMIDAQVPAAPLPAGHQVLIVVAPLQVLAPSVFDEIVAPGAYRAFDLGTPGKIGQGRGGEAMPGLNPDAIESWALDAITFEALTARLAPHGRVVLLSGDVHNSTATQMSYWRRGVAEPARILQFTSSGLKNVMPAYLTLIDQSLAFAQELIRADLGGDRMGWLDGADGAFTFPPGKTVHDVPIVLRKRIGQRPAHLPTYGWPIDAAQPPGDAAGRTRVRAETPPDFSWTLRPIFDTRPDVDLPPPGETPPAPPDAGSVPAGTSARPLMARPVAFTGTPPSAETLAAKGESAFLAYAQVANRHVRQLDRLSHSRQILFRSNLARVVFVRGTGPQGERLEAVHEVITVLPDPLHRADKPHLLKPEVAMAQRGELTPPADAVRPENRPLNGPLGVSLADRLRAIAS